MFVDVSETCAEGIFLWWLKMWKVGQIWSPFQISAMLKYDLQKRKQLSFPEAMYTTQKRPNFACDNYIFPKTRGNKNKQWAHSSPVKIVIILRGERRRHLGLYYLCVM